ncbi:MAG: helix-turn-helix domain-containing protein [Gammaproteobacteria bacterium]|nr:helix-turn-helix domain-containing protein [Gammaproteobacteria bacterium]
MNETRRILDALKRSLRARGVTYRRLGQALGLSESSVKRLFSDGSFTLARLESICNVLNLSVADLARMAADTPARRSSDAPNNRLTLEQERVLASDATLLACFYLLMNGRSPLEVERRLRMSARSMQEHLSKLAAAGLLESDSRRRVRLPVSPPVAWRPDGPVHRLYERQVRTEFLRGGFAGSNESLAFHSAELSSASVRVLMRKIDKLGGDFADLAALDLGLPTRDKTSVALLLACRPWEFTMFSTYRA